MCVVCVVCLCLISAYIYIICIYHYYMGSSLKSLGVVKVAATAPLYACSMGTTSMVLSMATLLLLPPAV